MKPMVFEKAPSGREVILSGLWKPGFYIFLMFMQLL